MDYDYEQEYKIIFAELLLALKRKLGMILLVTLVAAVLSWGVSSFVIVPQYEASVNMIVNARTEYNGSITNDNISSAQNLVETYAIIIKSNTVINQVIDTLDLNMSFEELYSQLSVDSINDTQVMKIAVRNKNPELAAQIVQVISTIAPDIVAEAVEAGSCKVVSEVYVDSKPVSPDIMKNTVLAAFLCMMVCVAVIVLAELRNDYIVDQIDVEQKLRIPVLGIIPNVEGR